MTPLSVSRVFLVISKMSRRLPAEKQPNGVETHSRSAMCSCFDSIVSNVTSSIDRPTATDASPRWRSGRRLSAERRR
jgi:hypothetical protein